MNETDIANTGLIWDFLFKACVLNNTLLATNNIHKIILLTNANIIGVGLFKPKGSLLLLPNDVIWLLVDIYIINI